MKFVKWIFGLSLFCIWLSSSSCTKIPEYKILSVKDEPSIGSKIRTEIKLSVKKPISEDGLKKLLYKILTDNYGRQSKLGRTEFFQIMAYDENDKELKNPVGTLYQALFDGIEGRIAFEYDGQVTYNKEEAMPVLSEEERKRQEEVGKFAGELIDAANKIQKNNR